MDGKISFFYIVLLSFEGEASSLMSKTFIPGKRLVRNWFCGALQTKPVYKPVFPEIGITRAGAYARTHAQTDSGTTTTGQLLNIEMFHPEAKSEL